MSMNTGRWGSAVKSSAVTRPGPDILLRPNLGVLQHSLASTSAGSSIPAASRNRPASIHAGRSIPAASRNRPASIHAGRSIHAASRNRPASIHAGRSIPAASKNRPASIHASRHIPAGRSVPTGWTNPAARPFFRLTNLYFDNVYWPGIYDHMSMNTGRWGSAVKSSVGCSWRNTRPYMQWGSKKNSGSHQSTWFHT
nr:hypothetical protein [Tanacetum cinerariifolium]